MSIFDYSKGTTNFVRVGEPLPGNQVGVWGVRMASGGISSDNDFVEVGTAVKVVGVAGNYTVSKPKETDTSGDTFAVVYKGAIGGTSLNDKIIYASRPGVVVDFIFLEGDSVSVVLDPTIEDIDEINVGDKAYIVTSGTNAGAFTNVSTDNIDANLYFASKPYQPTNSDSYAVIITGKKGVSV